MNILKVLMRGGSSDYWITYPGTLNIENTRVRHVHYSNNYFYTLFGNANGGNILFKYSTTGGSSFARQLQGTTGNATYWYGCGVDSSDNAYVVGDTYDGSAGNYAIIAKYNSSGTLQWQRRFQNSTNKGIFYGVAVTSGGNVYACGDVYTGTFTAATLVKYNSSGTIQWQRQLDDTGAIFDIFYAVGLDGSENAYVAGSSGTLAIIAKYNSSGTLQWQRKFTSTSAFFRGLAVDSSGNCYAAGQEANGTGVLVKYDSSGAIQWQRKLSGTSLSYAAVSIDSTTGNILVSGAYTSTDSRAIVVSYNTSGTLQWQRDLTHSGKSFLNSALVCGTPTGYLIKIFNNTDSKAVHALLPIDGTKTGTYLTSIVYAATSLTEAAGTGTDAAGVLTASTPTYTDAAIANTDSAYSITWPAVTSI